MTPSTVSVILENKTPQDVRFWVYNDTDDAPQSYKVAATNGCTTIAVTPPGTRLFGAWFNPPSGPSLFPSNTNPHVVSGDLVLGTTYKVVLTGGGITFGQAN